MFESKCKHKPLGVKILMFLYIQQKLYSTSSKENEIYILTAEFIDSLVIQWCKTLEFKH